MLVLLQVKTTRAVSYFNQPIKLLLCCFNAVLSMTRSRLGWSTTELGQSMIQLLTYNYVGLYPSVTRYSQINYP